ncbi:SRPBCC family protein [Massilia sp. G4R7]|uniref:SRPBCC family protein n=1 Tax=Massilia phyllostachyos TaxID=2898585 RepID=A0ABS8Q521_9BURK|nr:SRPBCC family protein [Massilia phyllostachyos]MCD2515705.1 SRPBCC family protein [Massilia phyllostachyos]
MTAAVQFDTFTMEREFGASPARVYAAFADPRRKRQWFAESDNHTVEAFAMQFEVGGRESASYRFNAGSPFAGVLLESDGVYLDLVPDQRIVSAATMAIGGRRISASVHTFEFSPAPGGGTRLRFTHQAAFFEGADGPDMRRAGWQQLLDQLQAAVAKDAA